MALKTYAPLLFLQLIHELLKIMLFVVKKSEKE